MQLGIYQQPGVSLSTYSDVDVLGYQSEVSDGTQVVKFANPRVAITDLGHVQMSFSGQTQFNHENFIAGGRYTLWDRQDGIDTITTSIGENDANAGLEYTPAFALATDGTHATIVGGFKVIPTSYGRSVPLTMNPQPDFSTEVVDTHSPRYQGWGDSNFGNIRVGERGTDTVTVSNRGLGYLSMNITERPSAPFSAKVRDTWGDWTEDFTGLYIEPGQSVEIALYFQPTSVGDSTGTLGFTTNDPQNPTVDFSLFGHGGP